MNLINKDVLEVEESTNKNVRLRVKNLIPLTDSVENEIVNAIYIKYGDKFVNTEKIGKALYESKGFRKEFSPDMLPELKVEEKAKGLSLFNEKAMINEKYMGMVKDIIGMENFLKDFTLIKEKEIRDIKIWEEYLVIATLLNMPNKVIEALRSVCPQPETLKNRSFSYSSSSISSIGRVSRTYSSLTRTSGSGRRSSGGGGSSGGGSGGGSR